jgi:hypothetical protein
VKKELTDIKIYPGSARIIDEYVMTRRNKEENERKRKEMGIEPEEPAEKIVKKDKKGKKTSEMSITQNDFDHIQHPLVTSRSLQYSSFKQIFSSKITLEMLWSAIIGVLIQRVSSLCSSQTTATLLSCARCFLQNSPPIPKTPIMTLHSSCAYFDAYRSMLSTSVIASLASPPMSNAYWSLGMLERGKPLLPSIGGNRNSVALEALRSSTNTEFVVELPTDMLKEMSEKKKKEENDDGKKNKGKKKKGDDDDDEDEDDEDEDDDDEDDDDEDDGKKKKKKKKKKEKAKKKNVIKVPSRYVRLSLSTGSFYENLEIPTCVIPSGESLIRIMDNEAYVNYVTNITPLILECMSSSIFSLNEISSLALATANPHSIIIFLHTLDMWCNQFYPSFVEVTNSAKYHQTVMKSYKEYKFIRFLFPFFFVIKKYFFFSFF